MSFPSTIGLFISHTFRVKMFAAKDHPCFPLFAGPKRTAMMLKLNGFLLLWQNCRPMSHAFRTHPLRMRHALRTHPLRMRHAFRTHPLRMRHAFRTLSGKLAKPIKPELRPDIFHAKRNVLFLYLILHYHLHHHTHS